ncbi:hypothetical protein LZG37_19430 [Halomonas titanicae]|uniref:hypothetical protein n=1 Tax=Vreelandella titanicae TaxID=664683 RepID=UPI001F266D50|nr:hypothetical protein [Halomonas titanicae]MCE7520314.1 hypothetical protein [Halomonas titanicae]
MKLKFLAGAGPVFYEINGSVINGIDTSLFAEGDTFTGSDETDAAGIFSMQWLNGELHVTLAQMTKAYQVTVSSHDWREGGWIDATDYDPTTCYVVAARPKARVLIDSGHAEYFQDNDGCWTVRMVENQEQGAV